MKVFTGIQVLTVVLSAPKVGTTHNTQEVDQVREHIWRLVDLRAKEKRKKA